MASRDLFYSTQKDQIKMHIPFFLYFTAMFCFYKFTYFQLGIQIAVILYFGLLLIKRRLRVTKTQVKHLLFYLVWFGAFVALMFLSTTWAYGKLETARTLLIAIRTFAIGFLIYYYADSKEKTLSIYLSFVMAFFITTIVIYITTPLSGWGSEHFFGVAISQQRNSTGAVSAPLVVLCYYLHSCYGLKIGKFLSVYFAVFTVIGGSRSAMLHTVIVVVLSLFLNEKNVAKKAKKALALLLIALGIVTLVYYVPFLYNIVWVRIGEAVSTTLGIDVADSSTVGRENLKEVATLMFFQRPLLGYGVDGVVCFLSDYSKIIGEEVKAVYSHCNYTEIAACFGVVGLVIWYVPIIKTLISSFIFRKNSVWKMCLFVSLLGMIIHDYSQITWSTHLNMYLLFIVLLLIRQECQQGATEGINK